MHFVAQFTHVLRHPRVKSKKQNKKSFGKTVLKMWSQIYMKKAYVSAKLFFLVQKLTTKNHKSVHNLCQLIRTKLIIVVNF